MAAIKSATLTVRIEPNLKKMLRVAAEGERRSVSNMLEVLIRDYCTHNGIDSPLLRTNTSVRRGKEVVKS